MLNARLQIRSNSSVTKTLSQLLNRTSAGQNHVLIACLAGLWTLWGWYLIRSTPTGQLGYSTDTRSILFENYIAPLFLDITFIVAPLVGVSALFRLLRSTKMLIGLRIFGILSLLFFFGTLLFGIELSLFSVIQQ